MSGQVFNKEFTRDNGLIIQEIWDQAHMIDIDGNPNPYLPTQITYIVDGVAEIWNNKKSVQWFKDQLLKKNQNNPDFFWQKMKEYESQLVELKKYWQKEYLDSVGEVKNFLQLIKEATDNFLVFYYSATDLRTPDNIKKEALKIRDQDTFYDDSNRLLAKTISRLYPELVDLEISVMEGDFDNMPDLEELEERYKHFVYITDRVQKVIKLKDFLKDNDEYQFIFDRVEDPNQVTGQIAYQGKVSGIVRILKRKNQVSSMQAGEILLSPMTTPDFVPAMKQAAAFVTDEGGIGCHAAIIAREMKKPCIIGTKVATQVFKDGDRVEVDADKGIVKKI